MYIFSSTLSSEYITYMGGIIQMSNVTLLSKIINSVDESVYPCRAKELLRHLVNMSKQGIIRNYEKQSIQVCESLYKGNFQEYMEDYSILFKDKVIRFDGRNLIILLFTDTFLFKFKYKYSNNSRQPYIKRWTTQRAFIDPYSDLSKKIQDIKQKGVKIPVSLMDYLICKPISIENDYSPEQLVSENAKRNLPDTIRIYYLLLMCLCNTNGVIKDYNCHFATQEINRLFGEKYFSDDTAYYAHRILLDVGLISESFDKESNCNSIKINGYSDGFGPKKRYIVISYALISDPVFVLLSNAAHKVIFELLSRLNNGEDKGGYTTGVDKFIQYKLFACPDDSGPEKTQIRKLLKLTKRRNSYEINKVMGEVSHFFDIQPDEKTGDRGYYNIRLKNGYFVKKECASSINIFIKPSERYYKKAALIRKYLSDYNISYEDKDYESIVRTLHRAGNYVIKKILYCLNADMKLRYFNGWSPIKNIGAYTYWLYSIYKKDNSIVKDKLSALFYKMNEEMEKEILEELYRSNNKALEFYNEEPSYICYIENDFISAV